MKLFKLPVIMLACALSLASCGDDDKIATVPLAVTNVLPADINDAAIISGELHFTELNSGAAYAFTLPLAATDAVPVGTYDIEGNAVAKAGDTEHTLRTVANQQVISAEGAMPSLTWFFYNPSNTLIFSEIYTTGSLNAKGTAGLYDSYFMIYNNTDEVQYADGLAICESQMLNSNENKIVTDANKPENNFTTQAVYVIPGSGRDVAIQPGQAIKIVDQAIDWGAQVAGALDHTDANFEWYDESTVPSVTDTDNPEVPNLQKWFSYSASIWLPTQQCNRSYALVRFPSGMTAEDYLANYKGDYQYISAFNGEEYTAKKCYLIKNEWIIDGVNMHPAENWVTGALSPAIDAGHAQISDKMGDKSRFGHKLARKVAGTSAAGYTVYKDTNDSSADFEVKPVK